MFRKCYFSRNVDEVGKICSFPFQKTKDGFLNNNIILKSSLLIRQHSSIVDVMICRIFDWLLKVKTSIMMFLLKFTFTLHTYT